MQTSQGWYPGAPTANSFYPQYTGGYSPPMSDVTAPPINSSSQGSGILGMDSSSLGTVAWGLALLAAAFILMHITDVGE